MTGFVVKEEELYEAIQGELSPLTRIQSVDDTFQTMEGRVVEPKPGPHGLLCLAISYSYSQGQYTLTPGVTQEIEDVVQETQTDAYELGKLLRSHDFGLIPVQLYKLGEE